MSTSDPRVERIERQARAAHSPGALITLLITGAAHTAIWIAAGYGIGILLDTFRLMSVNQVGHWTSAHDGTSSQLLGIGAIAVGSVLGVFFTGRLGHFGLGSAMIVPFCTAFLASRSAWCSSSRTGPPPISWGRRSRSSTAASRSRGNRMPGSRTTCRSGFPPSWGSSFSCPYSGPPQ
jgi:hypothetical protein